MPLTRCRSALFKFFSPAVGPLFSLASSLILRVVLDLDHASRRSGPCLGIIQLSITLMFTESAGFTQVVVGAASGCLTFSSVCQSICLSVCLPACHALRAEYGCDLASRVLLRPLRTSPTGALQAQLSTPALLLRPSLWPCASWSVGTFRHRHARFD